MWENTHYKFRKFYKTIFKLYTRHLWKIIRIWVHCLFIVSKKGRTNWNLKWNKITTSNSILSWIKIFWIIHHKKRRKSSSAVPWNRRKGRHRSCRLRLYCRNDGQIRRKDIQRTLYPQGLERNQRCVPLILWKLSEREKWILKKRQLPYFVQFCFL